MHENKLIKNGGFIADVVPVPRYGIYSIYNENHNEYMIAQRKNEKDKATYVIDIVGDYFLDKLNSILNGDVNCIRVVNCSVINHSINVRLQNKLPFDNMKIAQAEIVDWIVDSYKKSIDKNITVLISGAPGLGKTTVGFLVSQSIKKKLYVDPYLIKGFNVNSDEMQYHPVIGHYNPKKSTPIVLLLDEFDIAMHRASMTMETNEFDPSGNQLPMHSQSHAISANKTNLNQFLDAINDESHLIVVATTNIPITDIHANYDVFCRKGRFDMHFEMVNKEKVLMIEPPSY